MKKSVFLFAALFAATGLRAVCGAGEEYMPLVPGAFSPVEFDGDGTQLRRVSSNDADPGEGQRPALRKNIVRLTVPSLGEKTNAKIRMMEASPSGPDGTLQFRPLEAVPSARQTDIPGLVPPEFLAVSRMAQNRESKARGGFSPIRLPGALASGTEELREFDPYSVQRTGDPFRDAPGTAEAFPAAALHGRMRERPLPENNALRPPKTAVDAGATPAPPEPRPASGGAGSSGAGTLSLRPPAQGMSSGASLRPAAPAAPQAAASVTVAEITLPAALHEMPPLPELPAPSYRRDAQARRAEVVSLPPPLPDRAARNRGEFSLLSPSTQPTAAPGLILALPPTALAEERSDFLPLQPVAVQIAQSEPPAQETRPMQAPAAIRSRVPSLSVDEFTPMRGMRVY